MSINRRDLLRALVAAPVLPAARAADSDLIVAVNQTTIESAALFVQKLPGIRVVPFPTGRQATAQLAEGKADAASGNETQATLNAARQPNLRIVLTLAECRYRIVARRSAGIRRIADLRGKRIAYTPTTSTEYFLMDMLSTADLTLADVTLVALEPPMMPPAFSAGSIDAMSMWEPEPQNALDLLGPDGLALTDSRPTAYYERFNLNTTTAVLDDPGRRAVLVNAIKVISEFSRSFAADPGPYLVTLSKAINVPIGTIEKVWPQFRFPARLDAPDLRALLGTMEPWAASAQKRAPRPRSVIDAIVDDSAAREAGAV